MSLFKNYKENCIEAGCDEAGRGCLAGPVFAAAVILPKNFEHPLLNDSKKLSEKTRNLLRPFIEQNAIVFAVASVDNFTIDKINILNASILAMQQALQMLTLQPEHIIVDGNRFKKYGDIPYTTIVGGDGLYASIAAASVLAKTYRDEFMLNAHQKYPQYNWSNNKGYPTKAHRLAIEKFGTTELHRMSYQLLAPKTLF